MKNEFSLTFTLLLSTDDEVRYFDITPVQTLGLPLHPCPPPLSLCVCLSVSVPVCLSVCLPPLSLSLSLNDLTTQFVVSTLYLASTGLGGNSGRRGFTSTLLGPAAICGARCMLLLGLSAMSTSPVRYTSVSVLSLSVDVRTGFTALLLGLTAHRLCGFWIK